MNKLPYDYFRNSIIEMDIRKSPQASNRDVKPDVSLIRFSRAYLVYILARLFWRLVFIISRTKRFKFCSARLFWNELIYVSSSTYKDDTGNCKYSALFVNPLCKYNHHNNDCSLAQTNDDFHRIPFSFLPLFSSIKGYFVLIHFPDLRSQITVLSTFWIW